MYTTVASDGPLLAEVFDSFIDQASAKRVSVRLHVLETLRAKHQLQTVQCVDQNEYDFLGYAGAGHAKVELCHREENEKRDLHDLKRTYVKPSRLVEDAVGSLQNDVTFGRYLYEFKEEQFLLYQCEWELARGNMERLFFIVAENPNHDTSVFNNASIDALLLTVGKWSSVTHQEIYIFDSGYWQKSAELWNSIEGSSWDDVILDPAMKRSLNEDVEGFYDSHALYQRYSVPWKRGIILHGVPGNGKTASLRALVNTLQKRDDPIPSLYVKSFEDKCNGEQASIRSIFRHARRMAPCLLIFEDLDSLVVDAVRSYFLNEVDGLESNEGVLMIGSTNHLDRLDPAIAKRPSRFDRKYHFKVPNSHERSAYADYWRKKLSVNEDLDFPPELCDIIATFTEGFSFAYLKELFVTSLLNIARGTEIPDDASENGWENVTESTTPESENADSSKEKYGTDEPSTPPTKRPKLLPVAEIPDHLKNNLVLKVLHHQAIVLVKEMDNTEEGTSALSGDGSRPVAGKGAFCSQCGQATRTATQPMRNVMAQRFMVGPMKTQMAV